MNILSELVRHPGVLAAGEYSYRGDRFSCEGQLTDEMARMASIMCRATTMAVHMQADMVKNLGYDCGCTPARGWMVHGQNFAVCTIANVFCFIDTANANLGEIMNLMREKVPNQEGVLI